MDIVGSLVALVLSLPLLVVIAFAIALDSRGPILFRQQRVGLRGRPFTLLKFRSMRMGSDDTLHQSHIADLIQRGASAPAAKLTNDPRVTRVGRLLRRTSLDEWPQFLNVLAGSMSLVGPRPPIPYEVEHYAEWHKARLQVKPGITGLWQVSARSQVSFDDMVRLDLAYAESWSLWLDVKILFHTVRAVMSGRGAS